MAPLALLTLVVGFVHASWGARIKKVIVSVEGLPEVLEGFKIAQISDLHIGPTIGQRYVSDVVKKTNQLSADLITLTGDIGDSKVADFKQDALPLKQLRSTHGTFFVPGNHEY